MVVRAINRPRVSDPTQDNILAALADRAALARAKLDYFGGIRGQLSVRFDRLRKYLDIVLDDEVNEMAMYEKSLLRSITNDYAHMNDKLQRFAHPHLHTDHVEEIFKNAKKPVPPENYKERLERLAAKLYDRDDYYSKKETDVEQSVDKLVGGIVASEVDSFRDDTPSDVHILLSRFESLMPVQQDAQGAQGARGAQWAPLA